MVLIQMVMKPVCKAKLAEEPTMMQRCAFELSVYLSHEGCVAATFAAAEVSPRTSRTPENWRSMRYIQPDEKLRIGSACRPDPASFCGAAAIIRSVFAEMS
jgi:hypothetical protein